MMFKTWGPRTQAHVLKQIYDIFFDKNIQRNCGRMIFSTKEVRENSRRVKNYVKNVIKWIYDTFASDLKHVWNEFYNTF